MIAQMEAGSQEGAMAEVDIGSVVRDVAELYEPAAEETGVTFVVEVCEPVTLTANRELLAQALANLIDNALKYAAPAAGVDAARIMISASRADGQVVVSVADNGPGILSADRERALQRFVRLEESRSLPGSGLGLSLVAAVANLHHGTIELGDGNPGLVVTMRLPLQRPEQ
jgi:signal transduction histidine kinase